VPEGGASTFAQLSPDGRRVLALTPRGVRVWTLDLPRDGAETARWLDGLTDAVDDRGPGAPLSWR